MIMVSSMFSSHLCMFCIVVPVSWQNSAFSIWPVFVGHDWDVCCIESYGSYVKWQKSPSGHIKIQANFNFCSKRGSVTFNGAYNKRGQ